MELANFLPCLMLSASSEGAISYFIILGIRGLLSSDIFVLPSAVRPVIITAAIFITGNNDEEVVGGKLFSLVPLFRSNRCRGSDR